MAANKTLDARPLLDDELNVTNADEQQHEHDNRHTLATKSHPRVGVFVLANTLLGAGTLGLPEGMLRCGYAVGSAFLLLFAALSTAGMYMLGQAADRAGRPASFYSVANAAQDRLRRSMPSRTTSRVADGSRPGCCDGSLGLLFDAAIGIKCFGVACSYLIIIGGSMSRTMRGVGVDPASILCTRRFWVAAPLFFVAPLSYARRISAMRYTSLVALLSILLITVMILAFALPTHSPELDPCDGGGDACRGTAHAATDFESTLRALPLFVFAYTCHQNVVSVTNEMRAPTAPRVLSVVGSSALVAMCVYLVVSLSGYLTFGDAKVGGKYVLKPDILDSYPQDLTIVSVARVLISVVVLFCYPLQSHPSCSCFVSLVRTFSERCGRSAPRETILRPLVVTIFLVATVSIALVVSDLGVILSVVGATGSTAVSYILPGLAYYTLHPELASRWFGLALFCFGCVVAPLSLTMIFV